MIRMSTTPNPMKPQFVPVSEQAMTGTDSQKRFIEYLQAKGSDVVLLQGAIWSVYNRMVVPCGPACRDYSISPSQQRALLSHFKGALLVRYTNGFRDPAEDSPWYSVTCNRFLDLGDYTAHFRGMIRKGLKNCTVFRVDAEYVATHGYDVFMAAYTRYKNAAVPSVSRDAFSRHILNNRDFQDIVEYWAVSVGGQLAAFAGNIIFDTTEVSYTEVKLHPDFLKAYSSYALFFKMNEHYLRERLVGYVNDGFRSIGHETNVQEFLIQKFGFQRTPTNLYVRYRRLIAAAMSLPAFARRWIARRNSKYASLCALDDARTHAVSQ